MNASSTLSCVSFSLTSLRNSPIVMPPFTGSDGSNSGSRTKPERRAFIAVRKKLATESPGIEVGYWKARKRPSRARWSALYSRRSSPFHVTLPETI